MASKLVRANSLEPNVQNYDDARLLRFATGGYDGVVKGYRDEFSHSITGSSFKINGGEYVLQGWQAAIDGSGVTITVDNISGVQYYVVYLEVNLSVSENQRAEIKAVYNTAYYPTIDLGDDLTTVNTGIARRELYRFQASSGVISNVVKRFQVIEPGIVLKAVEAITLTGNIASNATATTQPITDKSNKVATTEFAKNAITTYAPVYKQITMTADIYAESKNYGQVTFTGRGFEWFDGTNYYFMGNFWAVRSGSGTRFNDVGNCKLKAMAVQGKSGAVFVDGGTLWHSESDDDNNEICVFMTEGSFGTSNEIIYRPFDYTRDWAFNETSYIHINGMVLKYN